MIEPRLRFIDSIDNNEVITNAIITIQYNDIEQVINNLNNQNVEFSDAFEYYPNQINSIFIEAKNSYGLDILCVEF